MLRLCDGDLATLYLKTGICHSLVTVAGSRKGRAAFSFGGGRLPFRRLLPGGAPIQPGFEKEKQRKFAGEP